MRTHRYGKQRGRSASKPAGPIVAFGIASLLTLVTLSGCAPTLGDIRTTKSDKADRIPTTIGVYPLLSTPVKLEVPPRPIYEIYSEKRRIYIEPPTETMLKVTPLSQMLTGLLSSELASRGFELREIPVEVPAEGDARTQDNRVFVLSMDLLQYLRANYDVQALLIGNAMFTNNPRDAGLVKNVYLKLVDAETLEILCQATYLGKYDGEDLPTVAAAMAEEFRVLAGLEIKAEVESGTE